MIFDDKGMGIEWIIEVLQERNKILVSQKDPTQMLVGVFELCQNEFDVTMIEDQEPKLYQMLQKFCSHVPEEDEELRESSRDLAKFFFNNSRKIRECDVQLYYAILNFIDSLKSKNMYLLIIYEK